MRDEFSPTIKKKLSERVALRCSNPNCRVPTVAPSDESLESVNSIGIAAHICAAAGGKGARRYDATMTSEQRKSIENGIWLCASCSILIDKDEITYSVDLLKQWKTQAEETAKAEHGKKLPSQEEINKIANQYDVQQKVIERLLKDLDDKDIALKDRDNAIKDWMNKYNELEIQLSNRTDDIAKQAKVLLDNGKLEEAEQLFKRALENDLKNAADNAFSLAKIKDLQYDTQEAINYYWQGLQFNPDNTDSWNQFGNLLQRIGKWGDAIIAYQKVLEIGKINSDDEKIAVAYGNIGVVFKKQGKFYDAIDSYNQSLSISEKYDTVKFKSITANQYGNLGVIYKEKEDYENAITMYKKSLKINIELNSKKGMALSYTNLGIVYYRKNNCQLALKMQLRSLILHKKLEDKQGFIINYTNLGNIYQRAEKFDKAIDLFEKSLKISIELTDTNGQALNYMNLGCLYEQTNDIDKAKRYWQQSIELFKYLKSPNEKLVQGWLDSL